MKLDEFVIVGHVVQRHASLPRLQLQIFTHNCVKSLGDPFPNVRTLQRQEVEDLFSQTSVAVDVVGSDDHKWSLLRCSPDIGGERDLPDDCLDSRLERFLSLFVQPHDLGFQRARCEKHALWYSITGLWNSGESTSKNDSSCFTTSQIMAFSKAF